MSSPYETTKATWKKFLKKKPKNAGEHVPCSLCPDVPLPETVRKTAFGIHPQAQSRIGDNSLKELEAKIAMRKTNQLSPRNAVAQGQNAGGSSPLQDMTAGGNNLWMQTFANAIMGLVASRGEDPGPRIHVLTPNTARAAASSGAQPSQLALPAPEPQQPAAISEARIDQFTPTSNQDIWNLADALKALVDQNATKTRISKFETASGLFFFADGLFFQQHLRVRLPPDNICIDAMRGYYSNGVANCGSGSLRLCSTEPIQLDDRWLEASCPAE